MEYFILKFIKRADIVDHLPDKVGWIVINAKIITVQDLEDLSPDWRSCHQILSSGPLFLTKKHRAVFNCYFYVTYLCQFYDWWPYFFYKFKIFPYIFGLIPSDKCCDHANT